MTQILIYDPRQEQWHDQLLAEGWHTEASIITGEYKLVHRNGATIARPEQIEAWFVVWCERQATPPPF